MHGTIQIGSKLYLCHGQGIGLPLSVLGEDVFFYYLKPVPISDIITAVLASCSVSVY